MAATRRSQRLRKAAGVACAGIGAAALLAALVYIGMIFSAQGTFRRFRSDFAAAIAYSEAHDGVTAVGPAGAVRLNGNNARLLFDSVTAQAGLSRGPQEGEETITLDFGDGSTLCLIHRETYLALHFSGARQYTYRLSQNFDWDHFSVLLGEGGNYANTPLS